MKTILQLAAISVMACVFSSGGAQAPDVQYVRQRIPVEIQRGKPVTIEIHSLSGNGVNDVGIRCAPEVWHALTNGTGSINVHLKSSNKPDTKIGGVDTGSSGTAFLGYVPNAHYLFYISGKYRAKATVEITFPNAPTAATRAEIIIGKTPAETGL